MSYGKCPKCGGEGIWRERRPDGNDRCIAGHIYPSKDALKNFSEEEEKTMRIYTNNNGAAVNAISVNEKGIGVEGHLYQVLAGTHRCDLQFQQGPVTDGINGATNEAILAILIHRIKFLNNVIPCQQNAIAITKLQEAFMWLENRSAERTENGKML